MRKSLIIFFILSLFLTGGCNNSTQGTSEKTQVSGKGASRENVQPVAALKPLPAGAKSDWRLPENLVSEGNDNFSRVVTGTGLLAPQALELAAGADAKTEYFMEMDSAEAELLYRFQFLSTQGTGRLNITAIGQDGRQLASFGYVFTGTLPERRDRAVWVDRRLANNYQGGWVQEQVRLSELFATSMSSLSTASIARYRVGIEAGKGQHVLITELKSSNSQVEGTRILWRSVPAKANQGDVVTVQADLSNATDQPLDNVTIRLVEPYGYGLVVSGASEQKIAKLAVGETVSLSWQVKAQRSSAVNLGRPWALQLAVNKSVFPVTVKIDVTDSSPGSVYYVMTEDLEPMDAAGYPTAWGNQNGWLDAEEFRVQLVGKAEALNRIAEKHGALWTHYLAMPVMDAGEWAASFSTRPNWRTTLDQVRDSIRAESKRGHEYALHLHSDYDPEVPGNVLSYNEATDGFWANHLRHGWAHSFPAEGNFQQRGTRTGILYHYLRELAKLNGTYPSGEVLTARTGSFDFGNGTESEAMSMRAYKSVGLWGNSDADGNAGGLTSSEYRKAVYLTSPDDINASAVDLKKLGLVEFRPTPRQPIMYDIDSAATMNDKVRQGMNEFLEGGRVRAGVQAITGFSHAMFIMGTQGWKSTVGGHFQALDEHLGFLKREYVQKGFLKFGTATDLVREYLDYYWPEPLALCGPLLQEVPGGSEFAVVFLGRNVPVDEFHKHNLSLKVPLRFLGSGLRATLMKNDQPLKELLLSGEHHEINFIWSDRRDSYRLVIGKRFVPSLPISEEKLFEKQPTPGAKPRPLPRQPENLLQGDDRLRFR